ncbi:MAG: hypothetical protein JNM34_07810 [Chthonomonadaceae bacterium]|nr:hypothetical protein [Chthonomonadaceae bacterium]
MIVLAAILVGFGVLNNSAALRTSGRPSESWVHEMSPSAFEGYTLKPDKPGSKTSYVMGEVVYKELDPVGITGQYFVDNRGQSWDAVIVVGDRMESFHDQRWCFKAQGWDIKSEENAKVKTKAHGDVPIKLVQIARGNSAPTYATFTFKGPTAFHEDIPGLSQDFFMYELFKQKKYLGTEYRIIPQFMSATKEDVLKFTGQYIDAVSTSSQGKL